MSVFSYKATTMEGGMVEGVIEAPDEGAALDVLRNRGLIPLKIFAPRDEVRKRLAFKSSRHDLLTFTTELAALLGAGLPLDRSLNILAEISESREMRDIVHSVLRSIREGSSFSEALRQHESVFPRIYVNMIRAGEAGGVLDVVLEKLNEFLESTQELKESLFTAMIYPVILTVTGGLSIIVLLTYVLPKFSVIFADMGGALPLPTQILLTVSGALQSYWWGALLLVGAVVFFLRNYIATEEGRRSWDSMKLKLLRDLIVKLETARFCRTLGTLLKSGVPLLQAMTNAKDVISNQVVAVAVGGVAKGIKEGKGMAGPLSGAGVFPQLALSMIKVGEETGQLDTMLLKVAVTYEKGLKITIKRFMGFIEPAMILTMGLVIGFIVLSMLMAIFSVTEIPF